MIENPPFPFFIKYYLANTSLKESVVEKLNSNGLPFIPALLLRLGDKVRFILTYGARFIAGSESFHARLTSLEG
jgi:hypothetical protein